MWQEGSIGDSQGGFFFLISCFVGDDVISLLRYVFFTRLPNYGRSTLCSFEILLDGHQEDCSSLHRVQDKS